MKISKIMLGFLYIVQSLYGMEGVREHINEVVTRVKEEYNYDATLIPEGFDEKNWGGILRFDEKQQCAFTLIGVYHYDKSIGWHCIHQKDPNKTLNNFEQSFNTADYGWKDKITRHIWKNIYSNFVYNQSTQTCIFLENTVEGVSLFDHIALIIKQDQKKQIIDLTNISLNETQYINEIACSNDGQYCAYGKCIVIDPTIKQQSFFIHFPTQTPSNDNRFIQHFSVKIFKKYPNGLYGNVDKDKLTQGDNTKTHEFDLIQFRGDEMLTSGNLKFLPNNSVQVHAMIPDQSVYLWTITPEGIKTKQECLVDLKQLNPEKFNSIYFLTDYKKLSTWNYRYHINDSRFKAFINIINSKILYEEKNKKGVSVTKEISLPKDVWGKIATMWYAIDPTLRENTLLMYDSSNFSEEEKQKLQNI